MLVLRLRRSGKKHEPHYRLVVQEKRSKLNGKYLESLGHFHPTYPKDQVVVKAERIKYWLDQGVDCSDTVTNLLVKEKILDESKKISKVYSPKKKSPETKSEAKAETPQAPKETVEPEADKESIAPQAEKETPA